MSRLIKKYKNRRLYDTEISQYLTLEQLQGYVFEGLLFRVEDSETGKDLTNSILLQILVEMETGSTQFLSSEVLRQIISLAHHPLQASFRNMMEQWFLSLPTTSQTHPYQQASEAWNQQIQEMMKGWQK